MEIQEVPQIVAVKVRAQHQIQQPILLIQKVISSRQMLKLSKKSLIG